MKRLSILLLCLLLLSSCAKHTSKRSIGENDIQRILTGSVDEKRMILLDKEEIDFSLNISPSEYSSAWVWQDRFAETIDEVGIFIASPSEENTLYQKLEEYVKRCKSDKKEWLESYNPAEAKKLENGTLFRYNNCMGYAFLNDNERETFLKGLSDFYSAQE